MKYFKYLSLFFTGGWLISTAVVDFVAIPTVFRSLPDPMVAGQIGIQVFQKFNPLELVCAVVLILGAISFKNLKLKIFSSALMSIVLSYLFYFTPGIISAAQRLDKYSGQPESAEYKEAKADHNFFHKTYVKIDGGKLLLLLLSSGLMIRLMARQKDEL